MKTIALLAWGTITALSPTMFLGLALWQASDKPAAPRHVEFPEVHDWNSVHVTLRRSACFGSCPIYRVEIDGDGGVIYEGARFVAQVGTRNATIPVDSVRKLVAAFRDADYYSLNDEYVAQVTDNPTYETSIEIDGRLKKVKDYVGTAVGMPMSIRKLERLIDQTANTKQWTGVEEPDR